jgi:hypothetical protein
LIPEPLTKLGHGLFGFISTVAVLISPVLPILSAALFVIYEVDEYFHLNDEAYQEIREYLYGFAVGLTLLICLRFIGLV